MDSNFASFFRGDSQLFCTVEAQFCDVPDCGTFENQCFMKSVKGTLLRRDLCVFWDADNFAASNELQNNSKIMKKILLAAMMLVFVSGIASAQKYCAKNRPNGNGFKHDYPSPHRSVRPHRAFVTVSYNEASTTLIVKFLSNSQGGAVEVFRDGAKVAGVTTNGGTTFSCTLRDYGSGSYNVIVSNGNTVVDSKNFTVK
jgi:hypothetical protein